MAIPQYGIGACGSSAAACRKERSASKAQNECICATPWLKNSCALGFEVVMGKLICPWPLRMRAGSDGAAAPGGGAHRSLGLASRALVSVAANRAAEGIKTASKLKGICLLQFPPDSRLA